MLPQKRKATEDTFSPNEKTMAAASEVEVKKEEEEDSAQGPHSHEFTVKFPNHNVEYTVYCDQLRSVLEAIKSDLNKQFTMMVEKRSNCTDEKIIIQLSEKGKESIVATHFPCSCIENDECLTIHCKTEQVEETKSQHDKILPRDRYSVFYISTKGGKNALTENLFKSNTVKEFDYLCVYAKKGTSVKEALKRDGRFVDLEDFKLSNDKISRKHTLCTQKVDNLEQKKFKICRYRKIANSADEQTNSEQQGQPSTSKQSQQKSDTKSVLDKAKQSGVSVKRAMEETDSRVNIKEIYGLLCKQYPHLKELMESRFTDDSYKKQLELKKENFGKIQQSFSEVHRVRKLLKLGESVCKVIVTDVCTGTGFVLFDRLILTNAHLFRSYVEGNKLQEGTDVYALFNYDEPEPNTNYYTFTANNTLIDFDLDLDYAILELNPKARKAKNLKVPPGLLSKFARSPDNGEACLIGHPAGEMKKIDPTCIIEIEKRGQAVDKHLHPYKDTIFIVQSITEVIKQRGIDSIMIGGSKADKVVTYNTFMYHGASGSPVFDAQCRVFGLHTAGYCYGFPKETESVIEFALPLLSIFESFVGKLKKGGNKDLLEKVQEEAKGNPYLEQIIESVVELRQSGHEGQLGKVEEETQESESLTEGLDAEEDMDNS